MFSHVFQPSPPPSPSRSRSNSYAPSPKLDSSPFSPRHPSHHSHNRTLSLGPFTIPSSPRARAKVARTALAVLACFLAAWVLVQRGQAVFGRSGLEELSRWSNEEVLKRESGPERALQGHGYPMSRALERTAELQETRAGAAALPTARVLRRAHHHSLAYPLVQPGQLALNNPSAPSAPLTPSEELPSLLHFLISTPNGLLPPLADYSPSTTPLKPEWVLDFDLGPDGPIREARMNAFEQEVWGGEGKLVVVGRQNHVWMKEAYRLLRNEYRVAVGEIAVVDLDRRADSLTITPLLNRLLATDSNLHIILGGTSIGGLEELKQLHEDGKLQSMLKSAGVTIEPPKVVKKKRQAPVKK